MRETERLHVLVVGGAGYIGSHVVRELLDCGHSVTVLDDLSKGHAAATGDARLVVGRYGNPESLEDAFSSTVAGPVDYLVHLAASSEVGESVRDPSQYYRNNLSDAPLLLDAAVREGIRGFVLSSTAAVYGEPVTIPIDESHPVAPTSPYGETKRSFEAMLSAYRVAHGLPWIALRYFNAAGAHPSGDLGEDHLPESHLIPALIQAARRGELEAKIFGLDYPTRDGSCVRDYVHVCDLARAHGAAMGAMQRGVFGPINLGTGVGTTVLEVLAAVSEVSGRRLTPFDCGRREGDPVRLIASAERAKQVLGWTPRQSNIGELVASAWNWHRRHPYGYDEAEETLDFEILS